MKKNDFLWLLALVSVVIFLVHPTTNELFVYVTKKHPYIMGFIKVGILATMGELLGIRILTGYFKKPVGFIYRVIVWGFIGMVFALVFDLFAIGVNGCISKGLLPSIPGKGLLPRLFTALLSSTIINLGFAPVFMAFHRITDTYIDLGNGKIAGILKVKLEEVTNKIDWSNFVCFVVAKTIPFFWIPAHTITFMLPSEYRVLMASLLSIALGAILSYAKKKSTPSANLALEAN